MLCSPFFPYLFVTLALNIPPLTWSILSFSSACSLSWWLWLNGPLCVVHIIASYYVVHQIIVMVDDRDQTRVIDLTGDTETGGAYRNMEPDGATSTAIVEYKQGQPVVPAKMERTEYPEITVVAKSHDSDGEFVLSPTGHLCRRLSRVLCYDAGVACYILAAVLWVVWQMLGMASIFRSGGDLDEGNDTCHVKSRMFLSLMFGWLYAMLVSVTFASSFLCVGM